MNLFERAQALIRKFVAEEKSFPDAEISSWDSPYYSLSQFKPYNPDSLVQKKGLDIYRHMMIDEQVKAVMMFKVNAALASGWKVIPASDEKSDTEIRDYIEYCMGDGMIERRQGMQVNGFKKSLKRIMSALPFGFSVTEKLYKRFESGPYSGKIGLLALKTRPPHSFEFHTDEFNNLTKLVQQAITTKTFTGEQLKYFVIYSYDADNTSFGGWYGVSDLRAAYRAWWSKDLVTRFLNIYLERFGTGILVGKYKRGASIKDQEDLLDMIKNIQAKSAFKIPEDIVIELLESSTQGQARHIDAIRHYDIAIARAVLVPDKIGFSNNETGAYAQSSQHFDVFMMILDDIRADIEELVNEQLIRDLVDFNFPGVKAYPKFSFNPLTQKDRQKLSEIFMKAVSTGVILATEEDEEHLRDELEFPKRTADSVMMPRKSALDPENEDEEGKEDDEEDDDDGKKDMQARLRLARRPNRFERKVNFEKVIGDLDGIEYEYAIEIGRVINRIKDAVTSTIIGKKIIENRDYDAAEKVDLKYTGDLRLVIKDALRKVFIMGKRHAKDEVSGKGYAAPTVGNLPPKEALEFFERKAFWLTGVERDHILKRVKAILLDGIKTGQTNADVIYKLEQFFDEYKVEQLTPSGAVLPVGEIPGRIETLVRTNFNDAYNQGRLTMFQDPDVRGFVVAYEYSGIADERQSDICRDLDGKIYNAGNPVWAKITPPNHPNCRSMLVPVLADEKYEESDQPDLSLLMEGFGK